MSENDNNGGQYAVPLLTELETLCKSNLLSEDGLRKIFERYGLTPNNDNALVSNNHFFLWACWNEKRVNEEIIRCLIEYFPTAASATDEDGTTPLHHACQNKSMTRGIIELLIDALFAVSMRII